MTQETLSDVFPLAVGNQWVYDAMLDYAVHGTSVNWAGQITEVIVKQKKLNSFPYCQMDHSGHHLGRPANVVPYYYIINNNYLYRLNYIDQLKDVVEGAHYGFFAFLTWPLMEGQVWGDERQLARRDCQNVWGVLGVEDVSTPADSFTRCYQIGLSNDEQHIRRWFCPGVGFVRYEYHSQNPSHREIWELKSYHLTA